MTSHIRSIPMVFDYIQFGTDVRAMMTELKLTATEVDTLAGYGQGNTSKFATHNKPNPEMNTFIACCNALDLDPRNYFKLK